MKSKVLKVLGVLLAVLIIVFVISLVASCNSHPPKNEGGELSAQNQVTTVTETTNPDGTQVKETKTETNAAAVTQPENPEGPASVHATPQGAGGETSSSDTTSWIMAAGETVKAKWMTIAGIFFLFVTAVIFFLRAQTLWIPLKAIPWTAGVATGSLGVLLLAWNMIGPILAALFVIVLVGIGIYLIIHNGALANLRSKKDE